MPKKKHVKAAGANAKSRSTRSSSTSGGGSAAGGDGEAQSSLPTSETQRPKRGKRAAADDADTNPPPAAKRKYTRKPVTKTKQYDYLNDIDSLAKTRSAKVCANRWSAILMARDNRKRAIISNDANKKDVDAMFDCSDLITPPTAGLLDREAEKAITKWKALDSRVVKTDFDDDDGGGKSDGVSADGSHKSVGGRPVKERMLPPNFDYQCRNKPPDEEDEDNNNIGNTDVDDGTNNKRRKRVISLLDPTQTQDYESELWKVFNSMPTAKEVEHQYALGKSDEAAATDGDNDTTSPSVNHGCQHTLTITNTLDKLRRKYTRIDAHSLGRLRIRDRHASMYNCSGEDTAAASNNSSSSLQTTLRFEILKPNVEDLRRGSGPDGNRLEAELHGSQHTLLDLHHTLVEHASINSDGGGAADIPAGVFLIADILYTHGDIGKAAVDSILEWLDEFHSKQGGKKNEAVLSTTAPDDARDGEVQSKPKVVPMDGIKLEDLSVRLGVRYTHINLQSAEIGNNNISWDQSSVSALFVTGIQSHPILSSSSPENREQEQNDGQSTNNRVPIVIHDIWTSSQQSQTHTMCAACTYLPATVATVNDVMTDASLTFPSVDNTSTGTPLCAPCFRELHYQRSNDSGDLLQLRPNRSQLKVFPVDRSG
eukprot:scaffold5143_cov139-Skeletonema_marinoi.AAC.6